MKRIHILIVIFLILIFSYLVTAEIKKPKIFVVHSYATDYQWVNRINQAINSKLQDKKYIAVRYFYLNSKHHPEKEYLQRVGQQARSLIQSWKPNVVIACNDDAQNYVAKYFVNDSSINIVFCGTSADPATYGYKNAKNVTGIVENIPFDSAKEVFLSQFPQFKKVLNISDASITSQYIRKEFLRYQWQPLQLVGPFLTNDFNQWKKYILAAAGNADFIYLTLYHTISDQGRYVSPQEIMQWTLANSPVPIIGSFEFFVADGGPFAVTVSPTEQGEVAITLALEIIESHKLAGEIPIRQNKAIGISLRQPRFDHDFPNNKIQGVYYSFAKESGQYYQD